MRYTSIFFSFPFGMFFACFKYVHKWTMKQPKEHVTFRFRTAFGNQWLISSRNGVYKWLSFNILPTKTETIVPINIPDTQRPLLLDIYVYEVSSKKQHKFDFFFRFHSSSTLLKLHTVNARTSKLTPWQSWCQGNANYGCLLWSTWHSTELHVCIFDEGLTQIS